MVFRGLETHKITHRISDASCQEKGKVYCVSVQTPKGAALFFPGFKGQDKEKVNTRLCEYEKNNPSDNPIPTLRPAAKSLSLREVAFPELSLAFATRANGRYHALGMSKNFSGLRNLLPLNNSDFANMA